MNNNQQQSASDRSRAEAAILSFRKQFR